LVNLDLIVGGFETQGSQSLVENNVQYTCPGQNCTSFVAPPFPQGVANTSFCCRTDALSSVTCCFVGYNAVQNSQSGTQMYRICSNNLIWAQVPAPGVVSTAIQPGRSYVCDTDLNQICFSHDDQYECFDMVTLTWSSKFQGNIKDYQGNFGAFCKGGDGKYYKFGGAGSRKVIQWDPKVSPHNVRVVGEMPPTNSTYDSEGNCCTAIPGQASDILVTLVPPQYTDFDFCLYNIETNKWGKCLKCPPSYAADLLERDCSVCGTSIMLGPGGRPYSERFTILDPIGNSPACVFVTDGDFIYPVKQPSMHKIPANFVPKISEDCKSLSVI
jgi:hypothetical protein